MMFRRKLLAVFALTVVLSVGAVAWLVSEVTRRAFAKNDEERTAALVGQFRRQFDHFGKQVEQAVEQVATTETVKRMALDLERQPADAGPYFESARTMAESGRLDFLEFVEGNGTIVSSAQWPAKFGYTEESLSSLVAEREQGAFLKQEFLPDGSQFGLFAVRAAGTERSVYAIGGRKLDREFISGLDLPGGMRVLLYENQRDHFSANSLVEAQGNGAVGESGSAAHPPEKFEPLIDAVRSYRQEMTAVVHWSEDQSDDEVFRAIPLLGAAGTDKQRPVVTILLVGTSRRNYVELKRYIRLAALLVGGGGMLLAILFSSWAAARVTRPVERLAQAAQEVAAGNWNAQVAAESSDELGQLAESFNRMTTELLHQRERLIQAERVAAWRELARRLAHELKNPLFPLQLTVENLVRARQQSPEQFEEVFRESAKTLLAEISNLKKIIGRFSDFSRMPQPQLHPVQVNDVIRGGMQLMNAQLCGGEEAKIKCSIDLDPDLATVKADAEMLHRAICNLIANALDAMPDGGELRLRTRGDDNKVTIEIEDTGVGLTAEECARIFAPYYTSKQHGTGLGLAIVQSVVSDHGGTIRVQSEPGRGTKFVMELPRNGGGETGAE